MTTTLARSHQGKSSPMHKVLNRAGLWDAPTFGMHHWAEACRRGLERARAVVCISDGAALPIGSSTIDPACKSFVQASMKQAAPRASAMEPYRRSSHVGPALLAPQRPLATTPLNRA